MDKSNLTIVEAMIAERTRVLHARAGEGEARRRREAEHRTALRHAFEVIAEKVTAMASALRTHIDDFRVLERSTTNDSPRVEVMYLCAELLFKEGPGGHKLRFVGKVGTGDISVTMECPKEDPAAGPEVTPLEVIKAASVTPMNIENAVVAFLKRAIPLPGPSPER
jgi:hypothetical protein